MLRAEALAFRDVGPLDLAVAPGACVALVGPTGAGKTLLLRALADLDPHAGRVFLDGVESASVPGPEWRRRVGLLVAESVWWGERVGETLGPVPPEWVARLGFGPEVVDWMVGRLSSGERQRLGLLRLLARGPRALLLDEPTAHLDPESAAQVEALVAEYRRERRAPVLWVTHDVAQRERVAARTLELRDGALDAVPPARAAEESGS